MTKIDLKKSSGFPLILNGDELDSQDLQASRNKSVHIDDLLPQLLNDEISSPNECYRKYFNLDHEGIFKSRDFRVHLYVIQPNLTGIEFIKTRAVRSRSFAKILEVWYGNGMVIMQKFDSGVDDSVIIKVKRDSKVIIPAGYSYSIVNTRQTTLAVAEISSTSSINRIVLDDMKGLAYYVIRKNAKQEIVRNPLYKHIKEYRKVKIDDICKNLGITLKTPIIKQILRKHEKFEWLFTKDPTITF